MALNLTENVKKYIKYGVITVGVGVAGFAIYKIATKKPTGAKSANSLKGIDGVKRRRRKGKKSKKNKVLKLN